LENPYIFFVINKNKLQELAIRLNKSTVPEYYNIIYNIYNIFKNGGNGYEISRFNKIFDEDKISLIEPYMKNFNNYLYFNSIFEKEEVIANRIKMLTEYKCEMTYDKDYIEAICTSLSEDQKEAIYGTLKSNVSIICGAAGTGKTTILKTLVNVIESSGYKCIISAFTGKAVARLKEVLGRDDPCTLNLLLTKGLPEESGEIDVLIIDEASMVSGELLYSVIERFQRKFCIYLIGDDSQLPPIEWGRPFYDMIKSGKIDKYELMTYHRFYNVEDGEINGIIENAKGLRLEKRNWVLKERNNFRIMTNATYKSVIKAMINNDISYKDFTILSPYNEQLNEINKVASDMFLPNSEECVEPSGRTWRIGDRVIYLINNYDINVMNGDEGIIEDFDRKEGKVIGLKVNFKNTLIIIPFGDDNIEEVKKEEDEEGILTTRNLARSFALTIHKSQGSEWNFILLYIYTKNTSRNTFISRNLLYTGITRARRAIWIITDNIDELDNAIKTETEMGYDALINLL
jgi:exodeoxyribonuclease V alpha subunit